MTEPRRASIERNTLETKISASVDLDAGGIAEVDTGIPFLDHMLDQIARHSRIDLRVKAEGDLHIDAHHTVEDVGIVLGQAIAEAVGEKRGIGRFGTAYAPLDEALSRAVLDFSGRPGLTLNAEFTRARVGDFDVDLVAEFFQGFVNHAFITVHLDNLRGSNAHHQVESLFKAFALALRQALSLDSGAGIPSTKGVL